MDQKTFNLQISANILHEFHAIWIGLGKKEKLILRKIQNYCRLYPNAHPTQSRIAAEIPCCRKHVNRTLKKFESFGWIKMIQDRGKWAPKRLLMQDWLIQTDLNNIQYFKETKVTSQVTLNSTNLEISSTSKGTGIFQQKNRKFLAKKYVPSKKYVFNTPPIPIRYDVDAMDLLLEQKIKLSMIPQCYLQKALESAKYIHSIKTLDDPNAYTVSTAIRMAQNDGIKIRWADYYRSVEHYLRA